MEAASPLQQVNVTSSGAAAEIAPRTSCSQEAITGKQQRRRWVCFPALPHITAKEGAGPVIKYLPPKIFLNSYYLLAAQGLKRHETQAAFYRPVWNTPTTCCFLLLKQTDDMGQDVCHPWSPLHCHQAVIQISRVPWMQRARSVGRGRWCALRCRELVPTLSAVSVQPKWHSLEVASLLKTFSIKIFF